MSPSFEKTPKIRPIGNCPYSVTSRTKGWHLETHILKLPTQLRPSKGDNIAANRALQLLGWARMFCPRQRRERSLPIPRDSSRSKLLIERVQLLVHKELLEIRGPAGRTALILGTRELPRADIPVSNFLPADDEGVYTNRIVSEVAEYSSQVRRSVLVRAPLQVQRIVQSSDFPSVIYGTPFHHHFGALNRARSLSCGKNRCRPASFVRVPTLTVLTREKTYARRTTACLIVRGRMSSLHLPIGDMLAIIATDIEAVRFLP